MVCELYPSNKAITKEKEKGVVQSTPVYSSPMFNIFPILFHMLLQLGPNIQVLFFLRWPKFGYVL